MQKLTRTSMDRFLKSQATDSRVLEIGVPGGAGYAHFFPNHTTLDINPERKPDVVGDIYELPFPDASFPTIVMIEVLEHLTEPSRALTEIYRVLTPGGTLILTTRFLAPPHDTPHDYFRFTSFGLEYLLRDWQDVQVVPDLNTMQTLGTLFQRLAYQTEVRGGKIVKGLIILCAQIFSRLNWFIKREYGDIKRSEPLHTGLLVSGYHVVARKSK